MEKRRASNGGSRLPEAVIQNILSFMSGKDAAQTSVLSKSWHLAWSTIPDLDLDQRHYGRHYRCYCDVARFLESAKKRIQTYDDLKLIIKSFRLSMDRRLISSRELADELTLKAMKLGVTELSLSVCLYLGYPVTPVTINAVEFCNLKWLCLEWLDIDPLFSDRSSSNFPCLKVLTLNRCFSSKPIYISITSLDCLTLDCNILKLVVLNVPSIRRFAFSGFTDALPSLTFETASKDWDSDISIAHTGVQFSTLWFVVLEGFLKRLSMSKVSLSLEVKSAAGKVIEQMSDYPLQEPAVVDSLKMDIHMIYIAEECNVLNYLFSSIEPKCITHRWEELRRRGYSWKADNTHINLLCRALMLEVTNENCWGYYTSSLPRLDHIIVEGFEKALAKWEPLPLKALLDSSAALDDDHLIRFRLQWRRDLTTSNSNS